MAKFTVIDRRSDETPEIRVGSFVSAAGKPGIVTEVLRGEKTTCIRLKSPDLIARRQASHDYSEIIELQYYVLPTTKDDIIAHANAYIDTLKGTINMLEQFKKEIEQHE